MSDQGLEHYERAHELVHAGQLQAAQDCAAQSLRLFELEQGAQDPDVANVLNLYGDILRMRSDWQEADAAYERSASIMVGLPADDPDFVAVHLAALRGRARIAQDCKRLTDADRHITLALSVAQAQLDARHTERGLCLNSLGMIRKYQGRLDEARLSYLEALDILSSDPETDPASLAFVHHNLSGVEHERRDFASAHEHSTRALELRIGAEGPDSPGVASELLALGAIVDGLGQHEKAREHLLAALRIYEAYFRGDQLEIAVILNNLGAASARLKQYVEGEAYYQRALAMKSRLLDAGHPDIAITQANLAALLRDSGNRLEALALYATALHALEHRLGHDHLRTLDCRASYEKLLAAQAD